MKKYAVLLVSMLILSLSWAQTVSDVSYVRNGRELTITYSLDKSCDIRVRVSTDGGATFSYPLQNMSGDVGKGIRPGRRQMIAYDLYELREVPQDADSLIRFSVDVDDGSAEVVFQNILIPMVRVEGGTFTMGGQKGGHYTYEEDLPRHKATVGDYYISKYEVTQQLWEAVMDTNPSHWQGNGQLPVEQVSWNDVQIFISRLSQLTGHRFRLPTEAEWEYAARGGRKNRGHAYPGTSGEFGDYGWYCVNSASHTHPVGEKLPNELGLYDMGGNVMEWCSDWQSPYTADPQDNPKGPKHGENKVLRGGCINSPSWGCMSGHRSWYLPGYGYEYQGFRLVLDSMVVEEGEEP